MDGERPVKKIFLSFLAISIRLEFSQVFRQDLWHASRKILRSSQASGEGCSEPARRHTDCRTGGASARLSALCFRQRGKGALGAPAGAPRAPLQQMDAKNKLYFGDNLKILREYVPDASVNLIRRPAAFS